MTKIQTVINTLLKYKSLEQRYNIQYRYILTGWDRTHTLLSSDLALHVIYTRFVGKSFDLDVEELEYNLPVGKVS